MFQEVTKVEILPKKDVKKQIQPITKCKDYSENDFAETPLYTLTKSACQVNDHKCIVRQKSFEILPVQSEM